MEVSEKDLENIKFVYEACNWRKETFQIELQDLSFQQNFWAQTETPPMFFDVETGKKLNEKESNWRRKRGLKENISEKILFV